MHNSSPNCEACKRVASVVDGTYVPSSIDNEQLQCVIGTFSELSQNQAACELCELVVSKLGEDPRRDAYGPDCIVIFWQWDKPANYRWSYSPLEDEDVNCVSCGQDHSSVTLIDMPRTSGLESDLNPNWVDLNRLKDWARHCDSTHQGTCHGLSGWADVAPPSLAPLLLVDVKTQSIVEVDLSVPHQEIKYAALSYVWGRLPDVLESTQANLPQLKLPGALALPAFSHALPETVRDAIALTHRLGLDYLWVDRLCIVQDDATSKPLQLAQMGAIYANSYLTIVAADGGDANYGLRGSVEGVSRPRHFRPSAVTHKPGGKALIVKPVFAHDYNVTEWERRGWTFQERALSRRNLVFQEGRVFWECYGDIWTEEIPYDPGRASGPMEARQRWKAQKPNAYQLTMSAWPDLAQYEMLVYKYSERILSFPSDGLNAFLGISAELSRSFRGGFLFGLPEYYFDIALLWAPSSTMRRRLVAGKPDPLLPSWSWAGWEGSPVNLSILPNLQRQFEGEVFGSSTLEYIEIYPTVKWLKTRPDIQEQEEVDNGYYEAVQFRHDSARSLPRGWASLLRFRAVRSYLFVGPRLQRDWEMKHWNTATNTAAEAASLFHIRYASGDWAGVLFSNDFDTPPAGEQERCEFIVVSGGSTSKDETGDHNGLEEWAQVAKIKDLDTYEFYNVLWIERVGSIAYRKALGRVWKDAWDRQPSDVIDVVLG
ncbi:heterokaryon incompatibility protein-domain-containing protein [Apiospora arundinis]